MQLHYKILGDRSGKLVTCLHGWLGSSIDWLPIVEQLAGEYKVQLIDLPGHGDSAAIEDDYDMQRTTEAVHEAILKESDSPSVLTGYSMGGRVALNCVVNHPQQFRALVLESASPGIESETEQLQRAELDDQRAAELESTGLEQFLQLWYAADLFASLREDDLRFTQLLQQRAHGNAASLAKALRRQSVGRQESLWDRLDELPLPVLLVAGEKDSKYTEICRRMNDRLSNSRLAIIAAAGHNVHFEQPQAFARTLTEFLTGLEQS